MSDTSETRTEWGVRLTWPDGYTEVRTHGGMTGSEPYNRRNAEFATENANNEAAEGRGKATAVLVYREITTTAWSARGEDSTRLIETTTEDGTPFFIETVDVDTYGAKG